MSFLKKGKPRENPKIEILKKELKNGSKFVKFSMNIPRSIHEKFRRKSFLDDKDMKDILMDKINDYLRS